MNHKITLPLLIITKIPRYDMHLHQRRAKPFKSNYARSTLGGLRRPTVGAPLSQQKAQLFMSPIEKSSKLDNVCYDIRGPVLKEAKRLEEEGNKVLKLNIGNPAPFGFDAPDEILVDVIRNLPTAQGYSDSKGLFSARKAIMQHYQARNMRDVTVEDIYIGNGVSELIVQSMQALLNSGDEMLVPAPDYPLWTAAVSLSGGKAVHYLCDEQAGWFPDLDDIISKITPRTRGIVIINPEQPDRRGLQQSAAGTDRRDRPSTQPDHLRRRDLRQDPV